MPATVTTLRASLSAILLATEAQIVLATGIDGGRVKPVARPERDVPKFDGDQDILLRFRGFRADYQHHRDRHDCRLLHRMVITIRTRFELGEVVADEEWLTDTRKGNVIAWQSVMDCLQGFMPLDALGNALTVEPVYVLEGDDGVIEKKSEGWGEAVLTFGVLAEAPLTQRQVGASGWIMNVL